MTETQRTIREAEGLAFLGLHQDAWEALETLPPAASMKDEVLAVRLTICTGLARWEMGREIAHRVSPHCPTTLRESASKLYIANAVDSCQKGNLESARALVQRAAYVWPEGREDVLAMKSLDAIW